MCVVLPQGLKAVVRARSWEMHYVLTVMEVKECVFGLAAVHVQFLLSLTVMLASICVFMDFLFSCVCMCA